MGQDAKAEALLERTLAKRPDDQDTLLALGQAYQRQGRLNESVKVLRRLVAQDETNQAALYELGISLGRLGQVGKPPSTWAFPLSRDTITVRPSTI